MSGPQCCANPPTLNPSSGAGHTEKVGGLDSYITGSPDSKLAILLISDVFGYEAPNLRKLADKIAAAGFYVVVPDFFYGEPYAPENAERPIEVWIKDHGVVKGFEDAKPVIEALNSKDIKVPISILGAEVDHLSPPALLKQFEEVLAAKPEVDSFVKIMDGQ